MRVMAFDFGLAHTGVAVGSDLTGAAQGVATLKCRDGRPNWRDVLRLIEAHEPDRLVVGLPLNMDGSESEISSRARAYADDVSKRSGIAAVMHDERLTSKAAAEAFEEARAFGRAATEHELAACYILESFLASPAEPEADL